MKVLHLTRWLSTRGGGIPAAVSALARAQTRLDGVTVSAIGIGDDDESTTGVDWSGVATRIVPRWRRSGFGYAPALGEALEAEAPDLLHLHGLWTFPAVAAGRWHRRGRHGLVVSPHGMLEPWALAQSALKKRIASALFQRRVIARADAVHALTDAEAQDIEAYCPGARTETVPNGIDLPEATASPCAPWPARTAVESRTIRTLLFLGRLHPKKNLPVLIGAFARPDMRKLAEDWTLVVAGWDDGGHRAELEALVADLGLSAQVLFTGPLFGTDKDAALRCCDAFVLPSLSEGLPMAVLEAWSYGKPVLMSDACNLPAGFDAGAAMRIAVEANGAERDLAAFLSQKPDALEAMGARGRLLVEREFAWDRIAVAMQAIYSRAIERKVNRTPPRGTQ